MQIKRDFYLKKMLSSRHNCMIKVITGLRRSGKSYLLFNLFADALVKEGVSEDHILKINLEDFPNIENIVKSLNFLQKNLHNPKIRCTFAQFFANTYIN